MEVFFNGQIRGAVSLSGFAQAFPYVYSSRSKAAKACRKAGFRGLCAKSQIEGYVELLDRLDRDWSELVLTICFVNESWINWITNMLSQRKWSWCLAFPFREFMGGQEKETGVLGEPRVRWSECETGRQHIVAMISVLFRKSPIPSQWMYQIPYIPIRSIRSMVPRSYKLLFNPHENYRYITNLTIVKLEL